MRICWLLCSLTTAWLPAAAQTLPTPLPSTLTAKHSLRPDEDWTSPGLTNTHLHSEAPVLVTRTETRAFTREMIKLQWRVADPIYVFVVKPKGVVKPPAVLYLYSYPQDTERFRSAGYCARMIRNGCALIGFESALTGERYRFRPMREWFVSELPESLATSAHDVHLILDYLSSRNDLDMSRIGMFGQGSGGAIALLAAGADSRIQAVDVLNPWGDWPEWMKLSAMVPSDERPKYVTPAFQSKLTGLEPLTWLKRLSGRHLRVQIIKADPDVPAACQDQLAAAVPPGAEVERYDDVVTAYGSLAGGRLSAWLGQQLKAQAAAVPISAVPPDK